MSTHLDDQGSKSRLHAAEMIIDIVQTYRDQGLPVVLGGDFNSEVSQEAYSRLAEDNSGLVDVRNFVEGSGVYGEINTYTGFGYEGEPPKRIDFIFLNDSVHEAVGRGVATETLEGKGEPNWKVNGYSVLPNRFEDVGVFVSDHRAVVADLELH